MANERKTILNNLATQLATITTGNGYTRTVPTVILGWRDNINILSIAQTPAYCVVEDANDERLYVAGTSEVWKMRPSLYGYIKVTSGLENAFNEMVADLHKLFNAAGFTLGSNCQEAVLTSLVPVIETQKELQFIAAIEITYKFAKATP